MVRAESFSNFIFYNDAVAESVCPCASLFEEQAPLFFAGPLYMVVRGVQKTRQRSATTTESFETDSLRLHRTVIRCAAVAVDFFS